MLFHYHFWTPYVEETENFYKSNGFHVSQRIGRYQGEFQPFNPPLTWEDFRNKPILFRIIEMRKGAINITFGYGKKIQFDHIGFLVSETDVQKIIENAEKMNANINKNERRLFIGTPYGFRIELQSHTDAVDTLKSQIKIKQLKITTNANGLEDFLTNLFGTADSGIKATSGDRVTITEATMQNINLANYVDPNGVAILTALKNE